MNNLEVFEHEWCYNNVFCTVVEVSWKMGPLDEFKASVAILMAQLNSDVAHVRHCTLVAEQLACREGQEKVEELAQMAMYNLNAVDAAELEEVHRGQRERSESALKGDREHLESALKEEREQNVAMRSCLEELEDENCLLKSTILNVKMEMLNERDRWRAEKEEMMREKELVEGMAVVAMSLRDLEIEKT
ncbi:hypothetical protein AOLI_G00329750 [Acnodon oligacanthus]